MKDPRISIALPSKTLFSDAALTFVDEGFWRGSLVLSLGLSRDPKPLSSPEFAALIRVLLGERSKLSPARLVRLHGTFLSDLPQEVLASIEAVVRTLKKYSFSVQLETTNGPGRPYFIDDVPWIVVKTRTPFLDVPCNEIHLTPEDGVDLSTIVGTVRALLADREMFFYIAKTRTVEELIAFCATSPQHWSLL